MKGLRENAEQQQNGPQTESSWPPKWVNRLHVMHQSRLKALSFDIHLAGWFVEAALVEQLWAFAARPLADRPTACWTADRSTARPTDRPTDSPTARLHDRPTARERIAQA